MLHIIQIINHMLTNLEYSPEEVAKHFHAVLRYELSLEDMLDSVLLEQPGEVQLRRIEAALPKFESALQVCLIKLNKI